MRTAALALLLGSTLVTTMGGCSASVDPDSGSVESNATSGGFPAKPPDTDTEKFCDVVIGGGSTAAFASALGAARQGARTCLLEPTDWEGGQLTASAVTAIDWGGGADSQPANVSPGFRNLMSFVGSPGRCWSQNCFAPADAITGWFRPLEAGIPNLIIYRNTVLKSVATISTPSGRKIHSVTAIQRTARPGVPAGGYDIFLHQDLPHWYDPHDDARYTKRVMNFSLAGEGSKREAVFVDATEWGEMLVLAGASYSQGAEAVDGSPGGDDQCGQATVFPFIQRYNEAPTDEPPNPHVVDHPEHYGMVGDSWQQAWNYRRVFASRTDSVQPPPSPGDLSEQNWGPGNDYAYGYLFVSKADAAAQVANWQGGVNRDVMQAAERNAFGWHYFYKTQTPIGDHLTMLKDKLGTSTGLSKMPYIRDTRRSVGLDGYMMSLPDVTGDPASTVAKPFFDRIAIGFYALDVHPLKTCNLPGYVFAKHKLLPFFVPFRALTNQDFSNLLVAGKTMAQSFMVNATTRLQPIEWATGEAAGVSAAFMMSNALSSRQALGKITELQTAVATRTPINWTINGKKFPAPGAPLAH